MTLNEPTAADEALLFCPACGYDLRASSDGVCNECGLPIDRASLRVSAFPWAHRREMGRVRGYVRTVWQVSVGSPALAQEIVKPQNPADAKSFARVTGTLVAVTLLVPFFAFMADAGGMGFLAIPINDPRGPWLREWRQDVLVPWAAGVTLWPVAVGCVILFGFYLPRAAAAMFRANVSPSVHPERAAAIALYATAPLAILPLAAVTLWGSAIVLSRLRDSTVGSDMTIVLVLVSSVIAAVAVGGAIVRVGQWFARVRRGGVVTGVVGAVGIMLLWIAGAFALFGLLPWCAGFLWLVIDSLR